LFPDGRTLIFRNVYNPNGGDQWAPFPQMDGEGIDQRPEEITFADINGYACCHPIFGAILLTSCVFSDGKADYVWTRAHDGAAYVWFNNYPNSPSWLPGGEIAGGVGVSGHTIKYATLQDTGRASYVAVNPVNGAIAAWLNGCQNLGPATNSNLVYIMLQSELQDITTKYTYKVFAATTATFEICNANPVKSVDASSNQSIDNPTLPTSIGAFNAHSLTGCTYSGPNDAAGTLTCDGGRTVACSIDPGWGQEADCGNKVLVGLLVCQIRGVSG
jgi:hypothetical protein